MRGQCSKTVPTQLFIGYLTACENQTAYSLFSVAIAATRDIYLGITQELFLLLSPTGVTYHHADQG